MNKGSITGGDLELQSPQPLVYSKQKNIQKAEHLIDLLQNHESEPISRIQTSNPHFTFGGDDLNVPITLEKGTQSCN